MARERRAAAHGGVRGAAACARLIDHLGPSLGRPMAGYMPIRTELDPRPAMVKLSACGVVALPVIEAAAKPLRFRRWTPGCATVAGPFGVEVPVEGQDIVPEVLIVPLLAFDRTGARLGYGGGFYDRTLAQLRSRGPVLAVGLAYAAQELPHLPSEPTDQPLDAIVTEEGVIAF